MPSINQSTDQSGDILSTPNQLSCTIPSVRRIVLHWCSISVTVSLEAINDFVMQKVPKNSKSILHSYFCLECSFARCFFMWKTQSPFINPKISRQKPRPPYTFPDSTGQWLAPLPHWVFRKEMAGRTSHLRPKDNYKSDGKQQRNQGSPLEKAHQKQVFLSCRAFSWKVLVEIV